jgi:SAM-dependent methyltransferase
MLGLGSNGVNCPFATLRRWTGEDVGVPTTPRWFTDTPDGHSDFYVERFRKMASDGLDLVGEARLIDALVPPGSRILDAGCGSGRVAAELFRRGHDVVGVDADEVLLVAAAQDHSGPTWVHADLTEVDLSVVSGAQPFDAVVMAGNVMPYLAPDTEQLVLERLAALLVPGGRLVVGFGLDRGYTLGDFDRHCAGAGLLLELRFATWDVTPFADQSPFAVTLLRTPTTAG